MSIYMVQDTATNNQYGPFYTEAEAYRWADEHFEVGYYTVITYTREQ